MDGTTHKLLTGERTLLNFIQQLSGVATVAHTFQDALKAGKTKVLDTRKTVPGFRTLQKYAVRVGGVLEALEVVKKNNKQNLKVEMEVEKHIV